MGNRLPALAVLGLLALFAGGGEAIAQVDFVLVNQDGPGEGYNDPAVRAPVGGNAGVTLGQQRQIAMQRAFDLWGQRLWSPEPVQVASSFDALFCSGSAALWGLGGPLFYLSNFASAPVADTWYPVALANSLAGTDLLPGDFDHFVRFNVDLDEGCQTGVTGFYYGLDNAAPAGSVDFLQLALHEIAHGLGFLSYLPAFELEFRDGLPDVYAHFIRDQTTDELWPEMGSDDERVDSAIRCREVVWDGSNVAADAAAFLTPGTPILRAPALDGVAGSDGDFEVGWATFGPSLDSVSPVTADLEQASPADGCAPLTGFTAGNIALIDRGTCAFADKVQNAQDAGAVGVVVANVDVGCHLLLGGIAPAVTIPAVHVTEIDGDTLKANLPGLEVTLMVDGGRPAGWHRNDGVLLTVFDPLAPSSSISHFDGLLGRSPLLMRPSVDAPSGLDLTPALLFDIGWRPQGFGDPGAPITEIPMQTWHGLLLLTLVLAAAGMLMLRGGMAA
jgi:hypothetical protein